MKDRQPTQVLSNGAIRYGVYNADGSLDHYEYLKREDAPTVEGTPLNKANLLSDATAAKIWRGEEKPNDPTVNDALFKLADGTARVGDVKITGRTDISSAWLPCDGRPISQAEYPDLFAALRTDVDSEEWEEVTIPGLSGYHASLSCANGHFFCVAAKPEWTINLAISDDLVTFETISIPMGTTWAGAYELETVIGATPVHYYNGKYLFACHFGATTKSSPVSNAYLSFIVYTDTPEGQWNVAFCGVASFGALDATIRYNDLFIYDGICYVMCPVQNARRDLLDCFYASSLSGPWTHKDGTTNFGDICAQDSDYGPIYVTGRNSLYKFLGLNGTYTQLDIPISSYGGLAVSGDTVVAIGYNGWQYSTDGGENYSNYASFSKTMTGGALHNTARYDGNICIVYLKNSTQHFIAATSALDHDFLFAEIDCEIGWFASKNNLYAGVKDSAAEETVKILKRDFTYASKRIPNIKPDGRSIAYIKAQEE